MTPAKRIAARKETPENRPVIGKDPRQRIRAFVKAVEALQREYAVEICAEDDSIALRDARREDDWGGYGEWDAMIFTACGYRMRSRNIHFEDFDAWGL